MNLGTYLVARPSTVDHGRVYRVSQVGADGTIFAQAIVECGDYVAGTVEDVSARLAPLDRSFAVHVARLDCAREGLAAAHKADRTGYSAHDVRIDERNARLALQSHAFALASRGVKVTA